MTLVTYLSRAILLTIALVALVNTALSPDVIPLYAAFTIGVLSSFATWSKP